MNHQPGFLTDLADSRADVQFNTKARHCTRKCCTGPLAFQWQDAWCHLEQMHTAAQTGKHLRHLTANRPGTENGERRWQHLEVKNRLVGQRLRFPQSWNRRDCRAGTGADCDPACVQQGFANTDRSTIFKGGFAEKYIDTRRRITLH